MVAVLLVLLALNISNVYSGRGFTYNDIESLFPEIVEKNTADDLVKEAITAFKQMHNKKLFFSVCKLKKQACEDKYQALLDEKLKPLENDCFPYILNDDIMETMYDNKDECMNQIIKPHVKKIKSEKKCNGLHTEEKDLFNVLKHFCQQKVNKKHVVENKKQRKKIINKLVRKIKSEIKMQLLPKDKRDKISKLQKMVNMNYNEFANAISESFLKALKWMKDTQKFDIRKITNGYAGEKKFKEELLSFYNQFPDDKVDEAIIKAVVENILLRLANFVVYDRLQMWILPTNGYNFDSLEHKSDLNRLGYTSINNKLRKQKKWFMEQDDDANKQQRWENELIHSLCVDMGKDLAECKTDMKEYCVEKKPGDVIAKWSTCSDVIAIKHYTDNSKACYRFRKTFRCDPKADRLCRPHIYVAWKMQMERVFKKTTEDYAKQKPPKRKRKRKYYHGIDNRCYDWKSLKTITFTGPMSWSWTTKIADDFTGSRGSSSVILIGTISDAGRYRPLDVSEISSKSYEGEMLFFDSTVDLVNVKWLRVDGLDEKACDAKIKHQQPKFMK